jgi:hypothetical protein
VCREPSSSRLWDLSCPLAPPSDGGQRAVIDHNRGAREPGWCASSATSCDDRLRHGWARSGEADVQDEVPSLSLSTPPPAQCTMKASKMMSKITTTTQKKNTTMPGMAYPATVLALATATSYPPPPSPGRGQRRHPCLQPQRQRDRCGGQPGTASTAATTTRSRKRCIAGSFFLPDPLDAAPGATGTEEPQPPRPRNRHHRGGADLRAVDAGRWHLRLAHGWSARRGSPLAGQRWQV